MNIVRFSTCMVRFKEVALDRESFLGNPFEMIFRFLTAFARSTERSNCPSVVGMMLMVTPQCTGAAMRKRNKVIAIMMALAMKMKS